MPCFVLRITPAYAGKRLICHRCCFSIQDHPRLRGEKEVYFVDYSTITGSPPLTRGKGDEFEALLLQYGITPAYAGKSLPPHQQEGRSWDHPRLRGEKFASILEEESFKGSPPLTRGKARKTTTQRSVRRITPAYAGKSLSAPEFP